MKLKKHELKEKMNLGESSKPELNFRISKLLNPKTNKIKYHEVSMSCLYLSN
jgi:hypothetical protein